MCSVGSRSSPWECVVPLQPSCVAVLSFPEAADIPSEQLNPPSLHPAVTSEGFHSNICQVPKQTEWCLVEPSSCLELGARVAVKHLLVNVLTMAVENANPKLLVLHKAWSQ